VLFAKHCCYQVLFLEIVVQQGVWVTVVCRILFPKHPMARLTIFIGLASLFISLVAQATYRVGFAQADVTPAPETIRSGETFMGGYGLWKARGAATGIHDPLTARVLYLEEQDRKICIVIVDSLGLPGLLIDRIATRAGQAIGADPQRIMIGATHSHAAPDLIGLWGGSPQEYTDLLIDKVVMAIAQAYESRTPALLYYARSKGKARNRRGWDYTDDDIVVLDAVAEDTGDRIAALINFAAHPVISRQSNLSISSDFVHYLREHAEVEFGAPVIYANGAIGDASPVGRSDGEGTWAVAKRYGEGVAGHAVESLGSKQPIGAGIIFRQQKFTSEIDNTVLSIAHSLGLTNDGSTGPFWNTSVVSSIAYFSLGDQLQGIAVPGEALTRTGLAMKTRLTSPAKLFLGLNGGCLGYFVLRDEWQTGRNNDYEESVSLGPHIAEQLDKLLAEILGSI